MPRAQILLVEDTPSDVELTRELLEEAAIDNVLHVTRDGEAALEFLYRRGAHAGAPRPDLILLDLNLPRRSGHEVLQTIKGDDRLKTIPVIVLTTSRADEDVLTSYRHHANCFISKPLDLDDFIAVVKSIEGFWLGTVRLPPREEP
jgi:chemotaxis family two-component system response regulator Rcp1